MFPQSLIKLLLDLIDILVATLIQTRHVCLILARIGALLEPIAVTHELRGQLALQLGHDFAMLHCTGVCLFVRLSRVLITRRNICVALPLKIYQKE